MKVTYEGSEFEINIKKAKSLGLLKEVSKPITSFKVGDTYRLSGGNYVVVVDVGYNCEYGERDPRYAFAGLDDGMRTYSPFLRQGGTPEDVLKELNNYRVGSGAVFVKNINEDFKKLLKSL